jgi:hypothetical protein
MGSRGQESKNREKSKFGPDKALKTNKTAKEKLAKT